VVIAEAWLPAHPGRPRAHKAMLSHVHAGSDMEALANCT
jgi:hypothetical protein